MTNALKLALKRILNNFIPIYIKKSFLEIWRADPEFSLHLQIVSNGNDQLFKTRFLWSDVDVPIQSIKKRFGVTRQVFLMTDRIDYPENLNLQVVKLMDIQNFNREETFPVICAFDSDEKLLEAIQVINCHPNIFYYCPYRYLPTARYFHRNDVAKKTLISELQLNLGKFDLSDFENILQALEITKSVKGDFVEIGVYRGDSAHAALEYMVSAGIKRKAYFFDLFDGFTNLSSATSNDAAWLNSHTDTSLQAVEKLLSGYPDVTVGRLDIIEQDLPAAITEIALCNIDVDMYEAVAVALKKVSPLVKQGGVIILEDQGHTPYLVGGYAAAMEFVATCNDEFIPIHMASGQMFLIKK